MVRIRRFGVIRTATVVAVIYALLVIIVFIPVILLLSVAGTTTTTPGLGTVEGTGLGAIGLVGGLALGLVVALLYAIVAWIFTAIACLFYNLAARFVGGIEVQVERLDTPPLAPAPAGWGNPPASAVGTQPPRWGQPTS
jgi:transmembrane protein DUF3566